jgi:hypothetical protein
VNALGYVSLARALGAEQTAFGLQAQHPEDAESEHSQFVVENVATEYLQALQAEQPHGPYQLIGMCRGAHIAYEMACRLQEQGETVSLLGVLDTFVMENTYNYFWYLEHYARRLRFWLRLPARRKIRIGAKWCSIVTRLRVSCTAFIFRDRISSPRLMPDAYWFCELSNSRGIAYRVKTWAGAGSRVAALMFVRFPAHTNPCCANRTFAYSPVS